MSSELPSDPLAVLGKLWDVALLLTDDVEHGLAERGLSRAREPALAALPARIVDAAGHQPRTRGDSAQRHRTARRV
ncbi:hypothetical protein AB0I53_14030 [Saccharopolyspora sp. NPDC050389]|uniref:hypothetical protein n=1 Tax=Saccharopolyspora sp. NPDC050389 TaxID=3155516 RepID=UPI00340B3666